MQSISPWPEIEDFEDAFRSAPGHLPFVPEYAELCKARVLCLREKSVFWEKGGFALIYRLQLADKEVVVRCPFRPPHKFGAASFNQVSRWRVPDVLRGAIQVPKLLEGALLVNKSSIDVWLMDWIPDLTLDKFVLLNRSNPDNILEVAERLTELLEAMAEAHVAHGDLQPKNIFVTKSHDLVLVDYDSFFVPGLEEKPCPIAGTPGYGHPLFISKSSPRNFSPGMDSFAGAVLLLSLYAIAQDPTRLNNSLEDGLVIPSQELEQPGGVLESLVRVGGHIGLMALILSEMIADRSGAITPWIPPSFSVKKLRYQLQLPTLPQRPLPVRFRPWPN